MNTLNAMDIVFKFLNKGQIDAAQLSVISAENQQANLPSSVFLRVLRAAIKSNSLREDYRKLIERAYGMPYDQI